MTDLTAVEAPAPNRVRVTTSAFWRLFPAGMRRRWWMFRLFDLLARHFPVGRRRRGVLVVRMDGIGDMVLFRQSLDNYAEAFGVAPSDITVLGCDSWKPIAGNVFAGYRVITIDEHAYARRPLYRLRVSLMVRRLAPMIAVCDAYLRRTMMADSLVFVTGAPRSVVSLPYISEPTRAEFSYYLSLVTEIIDTGPYPTHEIVRHANFIAALTGRKPDIGVPQISWAPSAAPIPAGAPYAVLNPGSNEHGRRWPFALYVQLAERLLESGRRVVFVGTRDDGSNDDKMAAIAAKPGVFDMTGKTSLPTLMDVLVGADVVVSNDTGPANLAIAVGRPCVVVVGGGHFTSFVPYPPAVTPANTRFVYEKMECYHCFWRCHKRSDRTHVFPCVAAVGLDQVWAACQDVMAAPSPQPTGRADA